MPTKINYVSEANFNIIQCKINVLLMIHVAKKLYRDLLKVIYENHTYKYPMIIIFIIIVIVINITIIIVISNTMNTMSAVTEQSIIPHNQNQISSHNQYIINCANIILCYRDYYAYTGSPCINKHFRSTECITIEIVTYTNTVLNYSRFTQRIIGDYLYYRKVLCSKYLFHLIENLVKLCAIILDYLRIKKQKIFFDKLPHMLVPYIMYLIICFIFIVNNNSQTSPYNYLYTKSNISTVSFHTNLFTAANITKPIFCIQSQNVYIKLIASKMSSTKLSMSKMKTIFQLLKGRYYNHVCENL